MMMYSEGGRSGEARHTQQWEPRQVWCKKSPTDVEEEEPWLLIQVLRRLRRAGVRRRGH